MSRKGRTEVQLTYGLCLRPSLSLFWELARHLLYGVLRQSVDDLVLRTAGVSLRFLPSTLLESPLNYLMNTNIYASQEL